MTNLRSFGQLITSGPISIQMKMGKSVSICCVTAHVMLSKQIHGIIASNLNFEFDDKFTQMTKYRSFGRLISFGPRSFQLKMGTSIAISCVTTQVMFCKQIHEITD